MLNKFLILADLVFVFLSIYLFFLKKDILLGSAAILIAVAFGLTFAILNTSKQIPGEKGSGKN